MPSLMKGIPEKCTSFLDNYNKLATRSSVTQQQRSAETNTAEKQKEKQAVH